MAKIFLRPHTFSFRSLRIVGGKSFPLGSYRSSTFGMRIRERTFFLTACSRLCFLPTIGDTSFIGPIGRRMDRVNVGAETRISLTLLWSRMASSQACESEAVKDGVP